MRHSTTPQHRGAGETDPSRTERHPQLTVSARNDMVIYGPKGEVLKRIEDRPFLGYGRRDKHGNPLAEGTPNQ